MCKTSPPNRPPKAVLLTSASWAILNTLYQYWLITLCFLLWVSHAIWGAPLFNTLALSSQAITKHHYWVYVSCNVMHANFKHMAVNLAVYAVLYQWAKHQYNAHQWAAITLVIGFFTALLLQQIFTIGWYVGLSAALHGLMVGVIWEEWQRDARFAVVFGVGLLSKLAYEGWTQGQTLNTQWLDMEVFWQSHTVGFLVGLCVFGVIFMIRRV